MKCQSKGCEEQAVCGLALNVPARGCPVAEHDPIRVVLRLQLCAACVQKTNAPEFFPSDGPLQKMIRAQAQGKAEPDFARAFASAVSFESEEWQTLTQGQG